MNSLWTNWRIWGATLISLGLIGGAYTLATNSAAPQTAEAATETALLQEIATKDSTGDGLPDWQKLLYGIPLHATTTDYFHLGMTDGEAVAKGLIVPKAVANVPAATTTTTGLTDADYKAAGLPVPTSGTLTDAFAANFFSLYLDAKAANGGQDLSDSDVQNLQQSALNSLMGSVAPTPAFKSAKDLTVSGTGAGALTTFATNVDAILKKNTVNATQSEIGYLQDVVENGNASSLAMLSTIATADESVATGISKLPVPAELAASDLELVNALMHVGEIVNDFSRVNTDPLTAVLALEQYGQATQDLTKAFADVGNVYSAAGLTFKTGTPGALFVNVAQNAARTTP